MAVDLATASHRRQRDAEPHGGGFVFALQTEADSHLGAEHVGDREADSVMLAVLGAVDGVQAAPPSLSADGGDAEF